MSEGQCTSCRNGNNCCTKQNEGPDLNDPYGGVRCAKQILSDSYQVEDSGDSLLFTCDPQTRCVSSCSWRWQLENGNYFECGFGANDVEYNQYIPRCPGEIKFMGSKYGSYLQNCDIEVQNMYSDRKGMWVCTTAINSFGKINDNVNVTFKPDFIGMYVKFLFSRY